MHRELVSDDTGPWLQQPGLQIQEGSLVLAAVLLQQSELERDILKQSEPAVELGPRSSDKSVAHSKGKSKSLLLRPAAAAVGGLVLGSSVRHVAAAQPMLKYLLQLGSVAHLEVCS